MQFNLDSILPVLQVAFYAIIAYTLVPLLTKGSQYIDKKQQQITANIQDEFIRGKVDASIDLIQAIVLEVAQTYVDPLKQSGQFDAEAAKNAKMMTIEKAKMLLSVDGVAFLEDLYDDATEWIAVQIEAFIKQQKQ